VRKELLATKLDDRDRELLIKVVRLRRETISGFLRRSALKELAALGFLTLSEKESLGVE